MRIALDYDGTYTADPGLWDVFIVMAETRGHEVLCVTSRTPGVHPEIDDIACEVIYTGNQKKGPLMALMKRHPDVWIDDHPNRIY